MKLGTQTASLTNHILSRSVIGQPGPTVGMGATLLHWTDREAATIVEVWRFGGAVMLTVQTDNATRTDKNGMSESQIYDYTPNPAAHRTTFRQTKSDSWQQVTLNAKTGRWNKYEGGGDGLRIGERDKYHDFSF